MANPINKAAWQKTFKGRPFVIEEAPMPSATPDQIIIKTRAIGINQADAAVQNLGMVYDASKHPLILGLDVAGEVYAVGSNITQFRPGDRVCGYSVDMTPEIESQRGSFQLYCAVKAGLVGKIPDNVSFSEASVFPSCLSVAAYSMFLKDTMGLQLPPLKGSADSNEQVLVVWGGSSVVGSCAVQMARLAGYEVIATASEMNFEHCRELGAAQVYDYKSCSAVEDIVAACREKVFAGVLVAYFNNDSTIAASKIAAQLSGNKIVGTVVPQHMAVPEGVAEGVKITANWGPAIAESEEGQYLLQQWLTPALADGRLKLSPRPEIVGKGLEALQGAVDTMFGRLHMFAPAKTISPRKIVVEID